MLGKKSSKYMFIFLIFVGLFYSLISVCLGRCTDSKAAI